MLVQALSVCCPSRRWLDRREALKPGDLLDAMDVEGQWYESIVVGRNDTYVGAVLVCCIV